MDRPFPWALIHRSWTLSLLLLVVVVVMVVMVVLLELVKLVVGRGLVCCGFWVSESNRVCVGYEVGVNKALMCTLSLLSQTGGDAVFYEGGCTS